MKMISAALLLAATCCFAPSTSFYIPDSNSHEEDSMAKFSCLSTSMNENANASIILIDFLCTWPKYMDPKNKLELIEFIQEILEVTGCTQFDFLESDENLEELMDREGALQKLILKVEQFLKRQRKTNIPKIFCVLLNILKNNSAETSVQNGHRRLTRSLGGLGDALGGVTTVLSLLHSLSPLLGAAGKLGGTIGQVVSPAVDTVTSLVQGLLLSNGGLLGSVLGGGPGGLLSGILGGGSKGGLLGGLLGGGQGCGSKGQTSGGLLNMVGSLTGNLLDGDGMLGGLLGGGKGQGGEGLLGGVTSILGGEGPLGGLLGAGKGQGGGGLLSGVTSILGGEGPVGGLLGGVKGQAGGLLGGLLGGGQGGGLLG